MIAGAILWHRVYRSICLERLDLDTHVPQLHSAGELRPVVTIRLDLVHLDPLHWDTVQLKRELIQFVESLNIGSRQVVPEHDCLIIPPHTLTF